jgi:hypothetical protein
MATTRQGKTGLSLWKNQLITKEDPLHVHKILGVLVLCSYIWRLPKVLSYESDMGFRSHPEWTLPTFVLHACLNLTSFKFHIPSLRIKSGGGRIWPEYRLHSLIFGARCIACMAINWYEDYFRIGEPNYTLNYIVVMLTMVAADYASATVRHRSNSIQELSAPPGAKFFFSVMQFMATSAALCGHHRRYDIFFYNLFVIQLTPFTMTLRRKNLVSHTFIVVFYGLMLGYGGYVGLIAVKYDLGVLRLVACMAVLWRLGPFPLKNKYFIWTVMHILLETVFRPVMRNRNDPNNLLEWYHLLDISDLLSLAVLAFGIYRQFAKQITYLFSYEWEKSVKVETEKSVKVD